MFPVRATVVPKVEEGSEFLTINASGIVDMETTAIEETEKTGQRAEAPQSQTRTRQGPPGGGDQQNPGST